MVALPVLALLLFITLLGIPLGVLVVVLIPVLLLAGYVVGVLFIARRARALARKDAPDTLAESIGFFALALLVVMSLRFLPFVGSLTIAVITVIGLGACALEIYQRGRAA